jgi:Ca2+-binding EF-hand superfamily protein
MLLFANRDDVVSTAKLVEALEVLKGTSGEAKTRSIVAVLDEDHDGSINLEEIAAVCGGWRRGWEGRGRKG